MLSRIVSASRCRAFAFALNAIGTLGILLCQTAFAQSTIFNIPTTDVVVKKKIYFEFDLIAHLERHDDGGFQSYGFSGENRFGYVTPGFSFTLPKNSLFNIGYSIANTGRKNNGLFVYYGITF